MDTKREKLIITVTANPTWVHPDLTNHPRTAEEIADCVYECYKAGASIAHIHAAGIQEETIKRIRDKCNIIIQVGLSGEALDARRHVFQAKPDMLSIMLTHHDEQFTREAFNILHLKPELEEYCRLCLKNDVKPEFEVWHAGAVWNLAQLQKQNLVKTPYFLSIFFGWPGGSWSPPTPDELLHRVKYLPAGSMFTTSVMDKAQIDLLSLSVTLGGHVRVGTEDYPFISEGVPAKDNAQLVARMAESQQEDG